MELYLMQHGLAVPAEEDPEQPLAREGVAQLQTAGRALQRLGLRFDLIACSPLKRSHQSAALIAEAVNYPYSDLLESDLLKPLAPPQETLRLVRRHADSSAVLLVGHLPSLAEITAVLLGNGHLVRVHFENAGLCRLDLPDDPALQAELRYCLTAPQLKLISR